MLDSTSIKRSTSLFVLALLLLSIFDTYVDGLRYAKYAIPFVCLIFLLQNKGILYTNRTTDPFILLAASTLLMTPLGNAYGLQDFFLYLAPLAPFLVGCAPSLMPRTFFMVLAFFFLVISFPAITSGNVEFSILDSKSSFENHSFSFVFGLFSIFFFLTKDKRFLILSLLFSILSLKRISLAGMVFVAILYYLLPRVAKKQFAVFGLAANIIFIFAAYYVTTESFNHISQTYFGVSSSYLTMGRTILYDAIFTNDSSLLKIIFGNGPGSSYSAAADALWIYDGKINLHSDVLKIYYELGAIVFLIFFLLIYRLRDNRLYLLTYLNIILLTDNVSTYFIVMYVYFYLSQQLTTDEHRTSRPQHHLISSSKNIAT